MGWERKEVRNNYPFQEIIIQITNSGYCGIRGPINASVAEFAKAQ